MDTMEFFGKNAGRVWTSLKNSGPQTLTQLQKSTGLTVKEVGAGLGWLAKEGKIALKNAEGLHPKFDIVD